MKEYSFPNIMAVIIEILIVGESLEVDNRLLQKGIPIDLILKKHGLIGIQGAFV